MVEWEVYGAPAGGNVYDYTRGRSQWFDFASHTGHLGCRSEHQFRGQSCDYGYYIASLTTNGASVSGVAGLYAYTSWWNDVQANGAITAAFASVTSDTATNGTSMPWLRQYYTNAADLEALKALANEDTDGDGMVTWKEYWSRTDPTDSNKFLYLIDVQNASNSTGSVIRWTSETGVVYRLTRSTNLVTDPVHDPRDYEHSGHPADQCGNR